MAAADACRSGRGGKRNGREQSGDQAAHELLLADDDAADLGFQRGDLRDGFVDGGHSSTHNIATAAAAIARQSG